MNIKLVLTCFLFWGVICKAQTKDTATKYPETVVIKMIESGSYGMTNNVESKMIIIDNNNEMEIKDLKRANFSYDFNDGIEYNTKKLRLELQIWANKGFVLRSSNAAAAGPVIITNYILQKM